MMTISPALQAVIDALALGVIPQTETPSAPALGTQYIVNFAFSSWPEFRQQSLLQALAYVDELALQRYGLSCAQFNQALAIDLVKVIARHPGLAAFWTPFRVLLVLGYYGHPLAAQSIGMPGPSIERGGFTPDGEPA